MSGENAVNDVRAMEDDKHMCILCGKELKSDMTLRSHKSECHDGKRGRIYPLRCQWCSSTFQSRKGLSRHLLSCEVVQTLLFPSLCPYCHETVEDIEALAMHSRRCNSWEEDGESRRQDVHEFEARLMGITRHAATARFTKELFVPAVFQTETGDKLHGFLFAAGAKRLRSGATAHVRPLMMESDVGKRKDDTLENVLKLSKFGSLVRVDEYRILEDDDLICHTRFSGNSMQLARQLEGLLIQSSDAALYALKVEVFGRLPSEDPHRQELAIPDVKSFTVVNVWHDNTSKVMIGTLKWGALVTMAVELTSGNVVVGPHNTEFYPHSASHVWLRKDGSRNLMNNVERQTRSKFDKGTTYECNAAVHVRFNQLSTMPVTLKTLWEHKMKGGWSGIKVACVVLKLDVKTNLKKMKHQKDGSDIAGVLNRLVEDMRDEETTPVSAAVNKHLTDLAARLQNEISGINKTAITNAVVKRIEDLVRAAEHAGSK
ncbi:hypothetical protein BGZ81_010793 [Podila clonocystis]|nr:hypothetical protein BGZ81_010793 [Podila clonocystis]